MKLLCSSPINLAINSVIDWQSHFKQKTSFSRIPAFSSRRPIWFHTFFGPRLRFTNPRPSASKKWIKTKVKRLHQITSTFLLSFLSTSRLSFLEWGDFHVHSRVSCDLLYIPGEIWGKENVCIYYTFLKVHLQSSVLNCGDFSAPFESLIVLGCASVQQCWHPFPILIRIRMKIIYTVRK